MDLLFEEIAVSPASVLEKTPVRLEKISIRSGGARQQFLRTSIDTVPLVVDLDGTLVATDTLPESLLSALSKEPVRAFGALLELSLGRAALKKSLDAVGSLRVATLPYRKDVLDFLTEEKERGRRIYLVTAASQSLADRIADHLGLFVATVGSDATINLKGTRKPEWIERNLGNTFDYVGNSASDVPIWKKARVAHLVGHSRTATQSGRLAGIKFDRAFEIRGPGQDVGKCTPSASMVEELTNFVSPHSRSATF